MGNSSSPIHLKTQSSQDMVVMASFDCNAKHYPTAADVVHRFCMTVIEHRRDILRTCDIEYSAHSTFLFLIDTMTYLCYSCRLKDPVPAEVARDDGLIQYQLGASESGELSLIRPVVEKSSGGFIETVPTRESWILGLPDELLDGIFAIAVVPSDNTWPRKHYACALAISAVSKRFHRIIKSFLYHTARFPNSCGIVPPCRPAIRFHRTMKDNTSLRPLCKALDVYVSDIPGPKSMCDYDLANDLLSWLPNVKSFALQGGFGSGKARHTWALIQRAVEHMPLIENFTLHREDLSGLIVPPIIQHLNLPNLKKLTLNGITGKPLNSDGTADEYPPLPRVSNSLPRYIYST